MEEFQVKEEVVTSASEPGYDVVAEWVMEIDPNVTTGLLQCFDHRHQMSVPKKLIKLGEFGAIWPFALPGGVKFLVDGCAAHLEAARKALEVMLAHCPNMIRLILVQHEDCAAYTEEHSQIGKPTKAQMEFQRDQLVQAVPVIEKILGELGRPLEILQMFLCRRKDSGALVTGDTDKYQLQLRQFKASKQAKASKA